MGHTHEKDETPYEFRQRLHEGAPLINCLTKGIIYVTFSL
jgi:hypothetical protein